MSYNVGSYCATAYDSCETEQSRPGCPTGTGCFGQPTWRNVAARAGSRHEQGLTSMEAWGLCTLWHGQEGADEEPCHARYNVSICGPQCPGYCDRGRGPHNTVTRLPRPLERHPPLVRSSQLPPDATFSMKVQARRPGTSPDRQKSSAQPKRSACAKTQTLTKCTLGEHTGGPCVGPPSGLSTPQTSSPPPAARFPEPHWTNRPSERRLDLFNTVGL